MVTRNSPLVDAAYARSGSRVGPKRSVRSVRTRVSARDLLALTKPRITLVVLATTGAGILSAPGSIPLARALLVLVGTVLIVASANTLNMWWEKDTDALMTRTMNRPLPASRLEPEVALTFGLVLGALSLPLLFAVNSLTGGLGLLALVTYVVIYTPLKRQTTAALLVGAVPGAMPPLMGWTSVTGSLGAGGLALFAVLFFWQLPHFLAISLFRSEDYARAGMKIVPVERGIPTTKWMLIAYTALLVAVSLWVVPCRIAGSAYLIAAMALGALFLALGAFGLRARAGNRWARAVFGYSIVYLVLLLSTMLVDRVRV